MRENVLPSWDELEQELRARERWAVAGLLGRAGLRLLPTIAECTEQYGPEALEWMHACAAALEIVSAFAVGRSVSRFTLDLAAEVSRGTTVVASNVARMLGTSSSAESAELVFAVVSYAADVARLGQPSRWSKAAALGVRAALATERIKKEIWDAEWRACVRSDRSWLSESLWPEFEPEWYKLGLEKWRAVISELPVVLRLVE